MSWSSDGPTRVQVVRNARVEPADLGTVRSAAARDLVVAPELIDEARREGFQRGYDEGFETGVSQALEEARARMHDLPQRLEQVIRRLDDAATALSLREAVSLQQIEEQVVAVAFALAEEIVGFELRHTPTRGADALARALALAPPTGQVVARCNPGDLDALDDPQSLAPGRALVVVADPSLAPGDCIVDVASCRIDARIPEALARVREILS